MTNTIQSFITEINNHIDVYFSIREKCINNFDIIDMCVKFAIMYSKGAKESWGDFQKRFVSIYEDTAKFKDEEQTIRRYSLFVFDSLLRNINYFLFMEDVNENISNICQNEDDFVMLSSAFLTVAIKRADDEKFGLDRIMDLAYRFYPIVLNEEDFGVHIDFNRACKDYISFIKTQLVAVYNKLKTDDERVNEVKEEILLALDICGPGPILDKFFLTRGLASIIARSIGLDEHEFFVLCGQAFYDEFKEKDEELTVVEYQKIVKEEPNHIFLRDGTQTIYDTLKCHYKENTTAKIDFIMALLLASMQLGNEINETKYYMIESITSYFSKSPNIPDMFLAIKAFIDVFNSSVPVESKIENKEKLKEESKIKLNTNWFSAGKTNTVLN
jgi:hypothetical protein